MGPLLSALCAIFGCTSPELQAVNIAGTPNAPIQDASPGQLIVDTPEPSVLDIRTAAVAFLGGGPGPFPIATIEVLEGGTPPGCQGGGEVCVKLDFLANADMSHLIPGVTLDAAVAKNGFQVVDVTAGIPQIAGTPLETLWKQFAIPQPNPQQPSVPLQLFITWDPNIDAQSVLRTNEIPPNWNDFRSVTAHTMAISAGPTIDQQEPNPEERAGVIFNGRVTWNQTQPLKIPLDCKCTPVNCNGNLCEMDASNSGPNLKLGTTNVCQTICTQVAQQFNAAPVVLSKYFCDEVQAEIRVNRLGFSFGFQPGLSPPPDPGAGLFTPKLFPGAKDFHLSDMIDVHVVAGGYAGTFVYGTSLEDADKDVTHDIAVAVSASGCPTICSTVFAPDCNVGIGRAIADAAAHLLPQAFGGALAEKLNSPSGSALFDYNGFGIPDQGKYGIPAPCTLGFPFCSSPGSPGCCTPDAPGCCGKHDIPNLASAAATYAKWDLFASAFGTYQNGGWMKVDSMDFFNFAGVPFDSQAIFNYDNDADHDGVLTPDDDCPFNYDPKKGDPDHPIDGTGHFQGQDTDCDGIADACDPCPRDPKNDEDHDGKCADIDNCPQVFNPDQANQNKVDEDVHLQSVVFNDFCNTLPMPQEVGDGCDPVPTPRATIVPKSETHKSGVLTCIDSHNNEMSVLPLQSHSFDHPYVSAPVHNVPTAPRYCQNDPTMQINCAAKANISDALFDNRGCAPPDACDQPEKQSDIYHRVTYELTSPQSPVQFPALATFGPNDPPPDLEYAYRYDQTQPKPLVTSYNLAWDFETDVARWTATGLMTGLNTGTDLLKPATLIGTDLNGAFWLHAKTPIGSAVSATVNNVPPQQPKPIGVRENAGDTTQLANVHMLANQARTYQCDVGFSFVHPPLQLPFYLLWKMIPDPAPDAFLRWDSAPGETRILVPFGSSWGALDSTGGAVDVTNRMGPALLTRLADPTLVWANAVEPFAVQGAGAGFPLAVALSPTGHQIVDTMTTNGAKLLADGDLGAARPTLAGSPHANGFAAVLSRARGGVFVVGGVNPETRAPTGQVWFAPLNGTRWSPVPVGIRPAQVVAASYSFANDSLYVVDMLPDPQNPQVAMARLWAHDIRHYSSRVIAMFPHNPQWDTQSLVIDRDGAVLFVSSSTSLGQSAIARVEVLGDKADEVTGVIQSARPLLMPPVVDQAGYSVAAQGRPGWPSEAVVALDSVKLREDSHVNGSVGVINGPPGECKKKKDADNDEDHNDDDDCAADHTNAVLDEGAQIHGDLRAGSVRLHEHAIVDGDLGYNSLSGAGTVTGVLDTPLSLPLGIALPPPVAGATGSGQVTVVAGGSITLAAGGYGDAGVREEGVLTLSGGAYQFSSLEVRQGARVQCQERCELLITGRLKTHEHSFFGAAENTMFDAADVVVTVLGQLKDKDDARPQRVGARFGDESTVRARVFLPDSTLAFGEKLDAKGTFVAARIRIGEKARVEKDEPAVARKLVPTLAFAPATMADLAAIL